MNICTFDFNLPDELIAQRPSEKRGEDRLLVLDKRTGAYEDTVFKNISDYIDEGSLLVINNTRVIKARIYGVSDSGSKVEFLLISRISDDTYRAMVSRAKRQHIGKLYSFFDKAGSLFCTGTIVSTEEESIRVVKFSRNVDNEFFDKIGHVPLPPYIKRDDEKEDENRYQTIYAKNNGSLACPTAGLHFTEEIFNNLKSKNIEIREITLDVGLGTFLPVRTENLDNHIMHTEHYYIPDETAEAINLAKKNHRKIVAVGTTSMRTLESAYSNISGLVESGENETRLFIKPGFTFHVVDELITNFHTPKSTLLVLVCAFAGTENILNAYKHAVNEKYRFYSYGDVTFMKSFNV